MIVDLVGSRSKIIHGAANSFEVRKFVGDLTKARKELGYESKTRLEDGLKRLSERMVPIIIAKGRGFASRGSLACTLQHFGGQMGQVVSRRSIDPLLAMARRGVRGRSVY